MPTRTLEKRCSNPANVAPPELFAEQTGPPLFEILRHGPRRRPNKPLPTAASQPPFRAENSFQNIEETTENIKNITKNLNEISEIIEEETMPSVNSVLSETNSTMENAEEITSGIKTTLKKRMGLMRLMFGKPINNNCP